MRKKTQKHFFDNLFWYAVYLAPLIIALFGMINSVAPYLTDVGFENHFSNWSWYDCYSGQLYGVLTEFGFGNGNLLIDAFNQLFSNSGILPLCDANNAIFAYMSYFVTMVLVHLAVDFLLFIPRIAHKFLNAFTKED